MSEYTPHSQYTLHKTFIDIIHHILYHIHSIPHKYTSCSTPHIYHIHSIHHIFTSYTGYTTYTPHTDYTPHKCPIPSTHTEHTTYKVDTTYIVYKNAPNWTLLQWHQFHLTTLTCNTMHFTELLLYLSLFWAALHYTVGAVNKLCHVYEVWGGGC